MYCNICKKTYTSYQSHWNHMKKFHPVENKHKENHICNLCDKQFTSRQSKWRHTKICKKQNQLNLVNNKKDDNSVMDIEKIIEKITKYENNQLIDSILEKNKKIELYENVAVNNINSSKIILNNIEIISRNDGNINATQICKAGNKDFNHWYYLDSTKQLITQLEIDTNLPEQLLVDIKKGGNNKNDQGTWVHPDLAVQLAQWVSPKFALQVSKWIRTLFTTGKLELANKIIEQKDIEIKAYKEKTRLLEDLLVKKQTRTDYHENNVIYILTTTENKNKRIYIIGKAQNLKNRLSTYNKTCEHEVVYYKKCKDETTMNIVENMILNKLRNYKEKANRDRFILPYNEDISYFIDIVNSCIKFLHD